MKQSENITISASPERVRTALTDLEDPVRWGDRLQEMSTLDGRGTGAGKSDADRIEQEQVHGDRVRSSHQTGQPERPVRQTKPNPRKSVLGQIGSRGLEGRFVLSDSRKAFAYEAILVL